MLLVLLIIATNCNLNVYQEVREEQSTILSEQREYLDKIKSLAVDVEYEEIQS